MIVSSTYFMKFSISCQISTWPLVNITSYYIKILYLPDIKFNSIYNKAYQSSVHNYTEFWAQVAKSIDWMHPWEKVLELDKNGPFSKWFVGGYLNACYNAVDRHVLNGKENKVALIHDSPLTNTVRHVTYGELYQEVGLQIKTFNMIFLN